jgi:DNA-binding winged helix-turn-helix (wHTH) protein
MSDGAVAALGEPPRVRFHDLVFEPDRLTAVRDNGDVVRLSRRERALLLALSERPQRLVTRESLLAVIAGDVEISDREVDVVIARLRRKLGDFARAPRFIATQYGEGYVWIAEATPDEPLAGLLVIGPVRGAIAAGKSGRRLLEALRTALAARVAPGQTVALRPDWRADGETLGYRFSLEASFLAEGGERALALVLRDEPLRQVIETRRVGLESEPDAANLAGALSQTIWRHVALGPGGAATPADPPLDVRMHEAALLLGPPHDPWAANELRVRLARADAPQAATTALLWAMTRYVRQYFTPPGSNIDPHAWARADQDVESLVFAALPSIGDDAILKLAAAKLLASIGAGRRLELAETLALEALKNSLAFAASLPILGQIYGWRGDLEGALARIDEARALAIPGSEFEVYLLVIRVQILLAAGDPAAVAAQAEEIYRIKPAAEAEIGVMLVPPGETEPRPLARRALAMLDETRAGALLDFFFHVSARRFQHPAHRANVIRGLQDRLVRRFGPEIVPKAVRRGSEL